MRKPWIIAHRGASGHAPENTMLAFHTAVELGATFIETDIHMTRDGEFVAIHDSTVERTTNGRGAIKDLSLAELRQLDAGKWYERDFMGQKIPTLDEILEFGRAADVVFYLEIKYEAAWGMHHALASAIRKSGDVARTIVLSFDPGTLESLRDLDATIMTGLLIEERRPDSVKLALRAGSRQLCPQGDLITKELVDEANRADLQVATWTINKPDQMRSVIAAGVNGVMTDYPDRLRTVIENLAHED